MEAMEVIETAHRPIRRSDRRISPDDAKALLASAPYGVLATVGEDCEGREAYAIPLSYVVDGDSLYFHCALEGRKLDNLRANPRVSFCVVGRTKTLPGEFATEYESAVVSGRATIVDGDEKQAALLQLLEKYSPNFIPQGIKYIAGKTAQTTVVRIAIEHLSGKARR